MNGETVGLPYKWMDPLMQAVDSIRYRAGWYFFFAVDPNGAPFLQIQFEDHYEIQYCRKWLLYETMNVSEVVRTAWMAVLAAEEHEARERFTYKGKKIFNPHLDVDALTGFSGKLANIAITRDPV